MTLFICSSCISLCLEKLCSVYIHVWRKFCSPCLEEILFSMFGGEVFLFMCISMFEEMCFSKFEKMCISMFKGCLFLCFEEMCISILFGLLVCNLPCRTGHGKNSRVLDMLRSL